MLLRVIYVFHFGREFTLHGALVLFYVLEELIRRNDTVMLKSNSASQYPLVNWPMMWMWSDSLNMGSTSLAQNSLSGRSPLKLSNSGQTNFMDIKKKRSKKVLKTETMLQVWLTKTREQVTGPKKKGKRSSIEMFLILKETAITVVVNKGNGCGERNYSSRSKLQGT